MSLMVVTHIFTCEVAIVGALFKLFLGVEQSRDGIYSCVAVHDLIAFADRRHVLRF